MGVSSALLGPKAVLVCTQAVEAAVDVHMAEQLRVLSASSTADDRALHDAIASIRKEEREHQEEATMELARRLSSSDAGSRPLEALFIRSFHRLVFSATDLAVRTSYWLARG